VHQLNITESIISQYQALQVENSATEVELQYDKEWLGREKLQLEALFAKLNADDENNGRQSIDKTKQYSKCLGQVTLLAATSSKTAEWFSQPLNFGSAGFILDIRRIIGKETEVDVYLIPNENKKRDMQKSLQQYAGLNLDIMVTSENETILDASIYVDELALTAYGQGQIGVLSLKAGNLSSIKFEIKINKES